MPMWVINSENGTRARQEHTLEQTRLFQITGYFIFIYDPICYTKSGEKKNSPYYLNIMANYHYHSENRVITWKFPYMEVTGKIFSKVKKP